jgi:hypothetical protein
VTRIRIRSWPLTAACGAIALAAFGSARIALAQVGKRNFIEPLIAEDPNPSNELELQPGWNKSRTGNQYSFAFSQEKTLTSNFSLEIADAFNQVSPRQGGDARGLGALEFLPKWAFFTSVEHEMRVALGGEIFLPVGDLDAGAPSHTRAGPMLMYAKGMGDLPGRGFALYLRPFAIQGDFAYLPAWGGPESGQFISDICLSYQFYYLSDSGLALPFASFLNRLAPFAEFNWQQIAVGRRFNTPPDFRITPALAYGLDTCQLTIGTQVALSHQASLNNQAAVIFLLDLYMDQIWPRVFNWTPF